MGQASDPNGGGLLCRFTPPDRRLLSLYLQVYRLADKYEVPAACMEPILAALSEGEANGIDLALLSAVYSLPAGLLESPPLENIVGACKLKLVELFGDVPSVITDLEQRRQFCALPYAAVLPWLRTDDLKVHSESCVLFLLTAWVNSKEHPACNPYQLKQLAHSVRVGRLSPTYLHCILPDLKWFQKSCSGDARFLRASFVKAGHDGASSPPDEGPAAWVADKRKGTAMPASVDLEWIFGAGDIEALDGGSRLHSTDSPDKAYLNGVIYKLSAQKYAKVEGDPVTLGLYLEVDSGSMRSMLDFWDEEMQPCHYRHELWAAGSRRIRTHLVTASSGWGLNNLLGRSSATIAEVVAPSLNDGCLSLKAVIKA